MSAEVRKDSRSTKCGCCLHPKVAHDPRGKCFISACGCHGFAPPDEERKCAHAGRVEVLLP